MIIKNIAKYIRISFQKMIYIPTVLLITLSKKANVRKMHKPFLAFMLIKSMRQASRSARNPELMTFSPTVKHLSL